MNTSSPFSGIARLFHVLLWCWIGWITLVMCVATWQWNPVLAAVITIVACYPLSAYIKHRWEASKRHAARQQVQREVVWAERAEYYRQERAKRADRLWAEHGALWEGEVR